MLVRGLASDDVAAVRLWLEAHRGSFDLTRAEGCGFVSRCLAEIRSPEMVDELLRGGVDPAVISSLWAPGYGLERIPTWVAEHLVLQGVEVTANAAAALGLMEPLRTLLDAEPEQVHSLGVDGTRPLHMARTVEVAALLLERGAEVDPRDEDHNSTPAQWRIGEAPDVTRFLLTRGACPDLFMAAGLGDLELARQLVRQNPACVTDRIGHNSGPFPGIGFRGRGGTIYQWTLGFNQSPHEIALKRGHRELFEFLFRHTPPRQQLLVACMLADRERATGIAERHPGLVAELDAEDRALLAKSCWETNLNPEAVRLMLDLGFPVDAPEFNHGFLPLHNAAWCGASDLVELLLLRGHPVNRRDPTHHATALGFALHSCLVAKRHPEGDFPRVVYLLLEAGTPLEAGAYPTGHEGLDAVIGTFNRKPRG